MDFDIISHNLFYAVMHFIIIGGAYWVPIILIEQSSPERKSPHDLKEKLIIYFQVVLYPAIGVGFLLDNAFDKVNYPDYYNPNDIAVLFFIVTIPCLLGLNRAFAKDKKLTLENRNNQRIINRINKNKNGRGD